MRDCMAESSPAGAGVQGWKATLKKLQIPSSKLQRSSKHQAPNPARLPGTPSFWRLAFEVSLAPGIWSLILSDLPAFHHDEHCHPESERGEGRGGRFRHQRDL